MPGFQNDATYGQSKKRMRQKTGLKVSSHYMPSSSRDTVLLSVRTITNPSLKIQTAEMPA